MERLFIVLLLFTGIWGCRNYHYIDKKMTWQDAQSYCRERHSDLATISNSRDNNIALKSKTNSAENDVWIGLNNNNTQGAWRWSEDSSDASFYNWNKGPPPGMERYHIGPHHRRPEIVPLFVHVVNSSCVLCVTGSPFSAAEGPRRRGMCGAPSGQRLIVRVREKVELLGHF
ncbi:Aggrecan core protein [Merluccius polli]|uniref:Aggrecan core protein n=1 Tax=Merluccius polli TaxID=89951 RepID=A0AA47NV92_MERPO|nr:Aggrecan core protein [Merluccius polli]